MSLWWARCPRSSSLAEMEEDPPSARSAPNRASRASRWRIPFSSGTTAGRRVSNLAFGFARFGLIDRRAQANLRKLLRSDTPKQLRAHGVQGAQPSERRWLRDRATTDG